MLVYPALGLLLLWGYLALHRQSVASIGFKMKDCSLRALSIGVVIGFVYALFVFYLFGPLIVRVSGLPPANLNDFLFLRNNWQQYFLVLAVAWVLVIPYEEIIFRGFILNTLRKIVSREKGNFWIAGFIASILFALYHWQEGYSAMIGIFIFSLFANWLLKKVNGNLWYIIFFHAGYDTVMLWLIVKGYMG